MRECIVDTCEPVTQILQSSGKCKTCDEFFRPNEEGRICIQDTCDSSTQIHDSTGNCEDCPEFFYANDL